MAVTTITRAEAGSRVRALNPWLAVAGLVLLSFAVRIAIAWGRSTPLLFPDEYIYTELGRSISEHGRLLVRGHGAHFPAVLAPLLTSPAWLIQDVDVAYRLVQAIQALAMSLAAVPVFVLARRLQLSSALAVAVAGLALCVPDFLYSPFVTAESFAYPLALAALAAGVAALERPSRRGQLLFVALAGLATLARLQFVVLPACFVVASLALGLRERQLRTVLREQVLALGLFVLGAVALAVVGIGYYSGILHLQPAPADLARSAATNLLVFAYAAGWAIIPGGLVGLGLALARPRDRAELAFGAMAASFAFGLFLEAAAYGSQTHERYTFYVAPMLALCFALYVRRGWPHRRAHALLAAALATGATLLPLTELSSRGEQNTAVLVAVHWVRLHMANAGSAALTVLTITIALLAAVALLARMPRAATTFALVSSAALGLTGYGLAAHFVQRDADLVKRSALPANPSWVDAQGVHHVALLQAAGGKQSEAFLQLFWNRSVDRVLVLPGASRIDAFQSFDVSVAPDGALRAGGKAVTGPLLVDGVGATVQVLGGRRAASAPNYDLWVPTGAAPPRLKLYFAGRFRDGWLLPTMRVDVWSKQPGTLRLPLRLPASATSRTLSVKLPDGRSLAFRLAPGRERTIAIPVCSVGGWHALLRLGLTTYVGDRPVSAHSRTPRFVPGAADCSSAATV